MHGAVSAVCRHLISSQTQKTCYFEALQTLLLDDCKGEKKAQHRALSSPKSGNNSATTPVKRGGTLPRPAALCVLQTISAKPCSPPAHMSTGTGLSISRWSTRAGVQPPQSLVLSPRMDPDTKLCGHGALGSAPTSDTSVRPQSRHNVGNA